MLYARALEVDPSQKPGSEVVTLMSADIDRIGSGVRLFHEYYASVLELGISLWLLYLYLGVAMAASTGFTLRTYIFTVSLSGLRLHDMFTLIFVQSASS